MGPCCNNPLLDQRKTNMKCTIVFAMAVAATVYSFPVEESSWSAQDDLLARVYKDSAPVAELLQDPEDPRVKHSTDEAAAAKKRPKKSQPLTSRSIPRRNRKWKHQLRK